MPQTDKQKAREKKRLNRKRGIAQQQVQQFEDELSGHELNLARLSAIPEAQRDDSYPQAVEAAEKSVSTIKSAIDTTQAEAEKLPEDDK